MKISLRKDPTNNHVYGVEIVMDKLRCNRHKCLYSKSCKSYSKLPAIKLNRLMKKLHIPVYICNNVANLSGTTSCSHSLSRKYSCYDCKHIDFDAFLCGYCKARKNLMVLDSDGNSVACATGSSCKYQEISDIGNCWDRHTGKCNYEI